MKRQLSQQEIDEYFQAPGAGSQASSTPSAVPFDFRRVDRIPKEQVGAIHFLYESFVKSLTSSLTAYLRSFVTGSVISVEQLPFADFVETLPARTCIVYLGMRPYDGHTLIELSPSLVSPILDLVLGGSGQFDNQVEREMSELEQELLDGLFQIITDSLRATWKPVVEVEFCVNSIETSPQGSGRFVTSEAVLAIAIELRIGESVGMVNLAMPSITLKAMGQRFDRQWAIKKAENPALEAAIRGTLAKHLKVTLDCRLTGSPIRLRDLINLKPGTVIDLQVPVETPVDISVNGTRRYKGDLFAGPKASVVLK